MSPVVKSPYWGKDSRLRPVNLNPSHYRAGRWVLLAEGVLLGALGVWGLIAGGPHPTAGTGVAGALLAAASTPAHCVLLLVFGVLAALATVRRTPTVIITGVGVGGFLLLFTIGTVAAVRAAPGILGFNYSESVLHAVLMAFNLVLLIWLLVNALQGPAWVRRRRPGADSGGAASGSAVSGDAVSDGAVSGGAGSGAR